MTHSICTLEFEVHRPAVRLADRATCRCRHVPHQYEFARLNLTYTVLSKRVLLRLVNEGHVRGWDDPRMPTISGLRRRGFPAEGIRDFAAMIGVAKADSVVEFGQLEYGVRERAQPDVAAALRRPGPAARWSSTNYPEGQVEEMDVVNNPEDPSAGDAEGGVRPRAVDRARRLHGGAAAQVLPPGARDARCGCAYAYFVTCNEVVKDADGRVVELRCTYDPATRGGDSPDGRRPKATLHWVSAAHARPRRGPPLRPPVHAARPGRGRRPVRRPQPGVRDDRARVRWSSRRSPASARARPCSSSAWATSAPDPDSRPGAPVFNRTLTLKDTWAKVQARG